MTTKTKGRFTNKAKEEVLIAVKPNKPYWSIKEIATYCGVTNANIGYHINNGHITLWKERPKLVEYAKNQIIIEGIRIKKQGYPDESGEE